MKILSLNEARKRLVQAMPSQDQSIELGLFDSLGHTLAEDIVSTFPIPSFRKSAMDGFAVYTGDIGASPSGTRLRIKDSLMAGDQKKVDYEPKTAIRIMTGAPVPRGYNAVIKQEYVDIHENEISLHTGIEAEENILQVGEDTAEGIKIMPAHQRIKASSLGVFASLGLSKVRVIRPIALSFLSTGSELIEPGQPLKDGKVYNSNIYHFAAFAKEARSKILRFKNLVDEKKQLKDGFLEASRDSDLVISTGGVSVGEKDYIHEVVQEIGGEVLFKTVAIRPGHPVSASKINGTIFLHTSGSPFAAFANFHLFFWPLLAKYYGNEEFQLKSAKKTVKRGHVRAGKLDRVVRGRADESYVDLEFNNLSSSITNLIHCNSFTIQKKGQEIKKGDRVEVLYLPE